MNESAPPTDPSRIALAHRAVPDVLVDDDLRLHHEFISPEEEANLLAYIDSQPWDATVKRRTQHYGRAFDYQSKSVSLADAPPPLPHCIAHVVERLLAAEPNGLPSTWTAAEVLDAAQVTINEYAPGIGIAAHVDTHSAFTDGIVSLTLAAGITFRMQRKANSCAAVQDHALWLPPRSLLVMAGASRYAWRHSISSRRYDRVATEEATAAEPWEWVPRARRVSVTVRLVLRSGRCRCAWPELCDTQGGTPVALPTRLGAPASAAVASAKPSAPQGARPARSIALALILFRVLNAMLVSTYHDPDEFWQCDEVAHRLVYGEGMVTWEWLHGLRGYTHILPFAAVMTVLRLARLDSPSLIAHAPRLMQGAISGLSDGCLWAFAERQFGPGCGLAAVACSCSSWFVWYVGVRTYSSCAEGALLAACLAVLPTASEWDVAVREGGGALKRQLALAAAIGALAVAVRPTALLLLAPLAISVIHQSVAKGVDGMSRILLVAAIFAACVSMCSLGIDRVLHGQWVLVPANFLHFNVFAGGAEYYGTHPWHWYVSGALPAALGTHMPLAVHGLLLAWRSASVQGLAPALAAATALCALSASAHKEIRFLYPIVHPILMAYAGMSLRTTAPPEKQRRYIAFLLLANLLPAAYLSMVHQRAPLALFAELRAEAAAGQLTHIDLVTRCHETPALSHLHSPTVLLTMLHCPPPALASITTPSLPVRHATGTQSDALPWTPSQRELRRHFAAASAECANECDCFLEQPLVGITRRYARARRHERWWHRPVREATPRSSPSLPRLPSHVALFDDLLRRNPKLGQVFDRLGYVQHRSFWHSPRLAKWNGMWPVFEGRRILLLRRGSTAHSTPVPPLIGWRVYASGLTAVAAATVLLTLRKERRVRAHYSSADPYLRLSDRERYYLYSR